MSIKSVAALVINWNGAVDTIELVSSLCKCQSESIKIDVYIVDNASKLQDIEKLQDEITKFEGSINFKILKNKFNVGVPAAYNQCVQLAGLSYEYYLRLDNDVIVTPVGLNSMISALNSKILNNVEIVGGNVKLYDHPGINNGGACTFDLVKGVTTVNYPSSNIICDGVLGCIMLISGFLVRRFTPFVFDSMLFICTDESELSLRAKNEGFLTYYISDVVGYHKSGVSTSKVSLTTRYFSIRNWTILRFRFVFGWAQVESMIFYTVLFLLKSMVKFRYIDILAFVSGVAIITSQAIDRRIKGK